MEFVSNALLDTSSATDIVSPVPLTQSTILRAPTATVCQDSTQINMEFALENVEQMKPTIPTPFSVSVYRDWEESVVSVLSVLLDLSLLLMEAHATTVVPMKNWLVENVYAKWDMPTILVKFALHAVNYLMASSSMDIAQFALKT